MSDVAIRLADPRDAQAIGFVHVASWRTTYPGIVDQGYIDRLLPEERAAMWERRLRDAGGAPSDVLVAETTSGEIVGFASGGAAREPEPGFDAELYAIYLLHWAQGGGVGRRLLAAWARAAAARGFAAAYVRVLAENPACNFYERMRARRLKEGVLEIGGKPYSEVWYVWDDLEQLAAENDRP